MKRLLLLLVLIAGCATQVPPLDHGIVIDNFYMEAQTYIEMVRYSEDLIIPEERYVPERCSILIAIDGRQRWISVTKDEYDKYPIGSSYNMPSQ